MSDNPVKSIIKALNALDILVFDDILNKGIGLVELSNRLEIKPNTLHNILKSLIKCGYASQNESGKYIQGEKCNQIGMVNNIFRSDFVDKCFVPELLRLNKVLDESVVLTTLISGKRFQIMQYESSKIIRVSDSSGNIYDLVSGLALICNSEKKDLDLILSVNGLPKGINSYEEFLEMICIENKNETFYKLQFEKEVATFAIPLKYKNGLTTSVFAIGCHLPAYRCTAEVHTKIVEELKKAKKAILFSMYK